MDSSEERENLWEVQRSLFPWDLASPNDRRPLSTSTPRSPTRRSTVKRSTGRTETHSAVTATSIDYNLRCTSTTNCILMPPSPRHRDWSPAISPIRNSPLGRSPDRVANPITRLNRHVDSSTSSPLINPIRKPTRSSTRLCRSAHSDSRPRSPTRPPSPNRDHSPRQPPLGLSRLRSVVKAAFCKSQKSTTPLAINGDTSGLAAFRKSVQRTWSSSRNRFPPYSRPRTGPKTRLGNNSTRSWKPNLNAVRLGIGLPAQYLPTTRLGPDVDEDSAESLTSTASTTSSEEDSAANHDVVGLRLDEVTSFLENELRERVTRGAYEDAVSDFARAFESIESGRDSTTELQLMNEYINAMSNFTTVIDSLRSIIDPLIEPNAVPENGASRDYARGPFMSPRADLKPDDNVRGQDTTWQRSQPRTQSQERIKSPTRSARLHRASGVTPDDTARGQRTTHQCSQLGTQSRERIRSPNRSSRQHYDFVANSDDNVMGQRSPQQRYQPRTQSQERIRSPNRSSRQHYGLVANSDDVVRGQRSPQQRYQPRTQSHELIISPNMSSRLHLSSAVTPDDNVVGQRTTHQCSQPENQSQERIRSPNRSSRLHYDFVANSEHNAGGQRSPQQRYQPRTQSQERIRSPKRSSRLHYDFVANSEDNAGGQRSPQQRYQPRTQSQERIRSPNKSSCLLLTSAVSPDDSVGQITPRQRSQPGTQSQERIKSPNRSSRLHLASAVNPDDSVVQRTTRQRSQPRTQSQERIRSPNRSSSLHHAIEMLRARLNKTQLAMHGTQWQESIHNRITEVELCCRRSDSQEVSTNDDSIVGLRDEDTPYYRYAQVPPEFRESTVPVRRHRYRSPSTNPPQTAARSARKAAHDIVKRVITDTLSNIRCRRSPLGDASTVSGSRSQHARDVPVRRVAMYERDAPSGSSRMRGEPVTSAVTSERSRVLPHPDPTRSDEFMIGFVPIHINVLRATRATNTLRRELAQLRQEHSRCLTARAACPDDDVVRPPLDEVLRMESAFESERQRSLLQCLQDIFDDLRLSTGTDDSELLQVGALRQRIINGIHNSCLLRRELHQFQQEHSSCQSSRVASRRSEVPDSPSQTDVSRRESSPEWFPGVLTVFDAEMARIGFPMSDVSYPEPREAVSEPVEHRRAAFDRFDQDSADQEREVSPIVQSDYTDQEVASLSMDDLCKVCMNAPVECAILECGHIATCLNCGNRLMRCPICRQLVVRVVRVFKS